MDCHPLRRGERLQPESATELGRRQFRRVPADIQVRPVSLLARAISRRVNDASLGGLRAYADRPFPVGARFELELLFREGGQALVLAEVVWMQALARDAPARFDVGLRYVDASDLDLARIRRALAGREAPLPGPH